MPDGGGSCAASRFHCGRPGCSAEHRDYDGKLSRSSGSRPRPMPICIAAASSAKIWCPTPTSWRADWKAPTPPSSPPTTPFSWPARATRRASSTRSCVNCVDPNRYELFAGQHSMLKAMGQPYSELGRVRIVDTRGKMAIGTRRIQLRDHRSRRHCDSVRGKAGGCIPSAGAL